MNEKLNVVGIAIRPGLSKNGILYTIEELNPFTATLQNRPILKDHQGMCDNTIGLIENSINDGQGIVTYEGWIKEDGTNLIEKIKDGRLKEVSIGAFAKKLVKENADDDYVIAVGLKAMELSLTPVPAIEGTSLSHTLDLITQKRTNEKIEVLPICENINVFENFTHKKQMEEKMTDEIPVEHSAPPIVDTVKVKEEITKQSVKVGIDMDNSKLDETLSKLQKIEEAKARIAKIDIKVNEAPPVVEESKTKGKVIAKVEEETENTGQYVLEHSELGNGLMLSKKPKADGSLI